MFTFVFGSLVHSGYKSFSELTAIPETTPCCSRQMFTTTRETKLDLGVLAVLHGTLPFVCSQHVWNDS